VRAGDITAVDECLENAVDRGLGMAGVTVDVFKGEWPILTLEIFEDIERRGENGNEIEVAGGFLRQSIELLRTGETNARPGSESTKQ